MTEPATIRLAKAWGKHKAGATLRVLAPGDQVEPGTIDPRRAAQLAKDGFVLTEPREAKPAARHGAPPATTRSEED